MSKKSSPNKKHTILYFAKAMRRFKKGFYVLYVISILSMIVLPFITMFGPKMMIDEITGNADISRIIQIAAVMVIAVFVLNTLNCFIG